LWGGTISGVRVSKKTDYRPRRQEAIRSKRGDMLWIAKSSQRYLKCTSIAVSLNPMKGENETFKRRKKARLLLTLPERGFL
jgi:hypothetical protein